MSNQEVITREPEDHPLFRRPFYTDWTIWLAALGIGVGVENAADSYPNAFWASDTYDLLASSIDVALAILVQALFLGILPAVLRRAIKRRRTGFQDIRPEFATFRFWLLALVVGAVTWVATDAIKESSGSALPEIQCNQQGEDTICIKATPLNRSTFMLESSWTYPVVKFLEGQAIKSWSWTTTVNCESRTGQLTDLRALGIDGSILPISAQVVVQVQGTMEADQIPQLIDGACT